MNRESTMRRMKRQSMRRNGATFTQRVLLAVRSGKPIQNINWTDETLVKNKLEIKGVAS